MVNDHLTSGVRNYKQTHVHTNVRKPKHSLGKLCIHDNKFN